MTERTGPKQIRCQFTLDVDTNPAHDYALVVLRQWLKQQEQCHANDENAVAVSEFNRQIYLSGLFLHLLDSGLPATLADSFGPTQVQLSTLCDQLDLSPRANLGGGESQLPQQLPQQLAQLLQQQQQLQQQLQQQNQQLTEQLQSLQQQLAGAQLSAAVTPSAHRNEPITAGANDSDLPSADTMQKVANVKAKGLW
ncbi:hypothetical protein [uncultured Ferrimonas sp.]|uniref:hypothetical protein n=1 Tax=uncultured Ferrimonas sp. TaxID=432640 RepID=UPI002617EBAF|nr:hypothetical protein [uncultured Ferrimonas sp.]